MEWGEGGVEAWVQLVSHLERHGEKPRMPFKVWGEGLKLRVPRQGKAAVTSTQCLNPPGTHE